MKENYIENNDYIMKNTYIKKEKDTRNIIYYITFDTFQKLCMKYKTEIANNVRDYFITLHKFIDYYK